MANVGFRGFVQAIWYITKKYSSQLDYADGASCEKGRGTGWTIADPSFYAPGRVLPNSSTAFPPPGRWLVRLASNAMMFVSRALVWWRMEKGEGQLEVGRMGGNLPKPSPSRDNE